MTKLPLNPWTKTDGMIITLISLWLHYKETEGKKYVHAHELIQTGFAPTIVYDFYDDLIRNELAKPYDEKNRSLKPFIMPTPNGLTTFLKFYKMRLDEKPKSQIEIVLLEETCKTLEKLQTLFFLSEGH